MSVHTPSSAAAQAFLLASDHADQGRFDEAETAFANAVLLAPDWPIARYQLGLLQFSSGRAGAALVTWMPLMTGTDALGHYVRGFDALARDEFTQAIAHFRAGLACPQEIEAVAGDIEKVLARIAAVQPEPDVSTHVLVSNYGRFGNLH
jgi:tetratricopeptide (TPR) repeat protein